MTTIKWQSSGASHTGNVRPHNEDAYFELPDQRMWLVADGMGGHEAGDVASQTIVDCFKTFNQRKKARSLKQMVADATRRLSRANRTMRKLAKQKQQMSDQEVLVGSTVVVLLTWGSRCAVIWAGDSRVYRYRRRKIVQLTKDHSEVQKLVDMGIIDAEHAAFHPMSNLITNALGVFDKLKIDVLYDEFKPGDQFILCSDGLTGEMNEYEIIEQIKSVKKPLLASTLIDATLARTARDNVTVVNVWRGR